MSISAFASETDRKEKLMTLLEELEKSLRFKPQQKTLKYGFYDRVFNGVAEVQKIGKSNLRLKRESGKRLGVLHVTPEIARLTKKGDHLLATFGHRFGHWYLISIQMVGSSVCDANGEEQMHLSVSAKNLSEAVLERANRNNSLQ